jgi:hypothetical protein
MFHILRLLPHLTFYICISVGIICSYEGSDFFHNSSGSAQCNALYRVSEEDCLVKKYWESPAGKFVPVTTPWLLTVALSWGGWSSFTLLLCHASWTVRVFVTKFVITNVAYTRTSNIQDWRTEGTNLWVACSKISCWSSHQTNDRDITKRIKGIV